MRFSRIPLVLATVTALTVSMSIVASAQPSRYCFESSIRTSDGVHFTVTMADGWNTTCWPDQVVGIDIYRRGLGIRCGDDFRITATPLPWTENPIPGNGAYVRAEIIDPTAQPNTAYRYLARAVDAERDPVAGNPDAPMGMATTGEALVAHGRLAMVPAGCTSSEIRIFDCDAECFHPYLRVPSVPAEFQHYVDSATQLLIYGEVATARDCNFLAPFLRLTRAVPAECVLGIEPVTWSSVKRLYD
jgi:hypothetical protein